MHRMSRTEKEDAIKKWVHLLSTEDGLTDFPATTYTIDKESSMLWRGEDRAIFIPLMKAILNTYQPLIFKNFGSSRKFIEEKYLPLVKSKLKEAQNELKKVKKDATPSETKEAKEEESKKTQAFIAKRIQSFEKDVQHYQIALDVWEKPSSLFYKEKHVSYHINGLSFTFIDYLACYFYAASDASMEVFKYHHVNFVSEEQTKQESKHPASTLTRADYLRQKSTETVPLLSFPNHRDLLESSIAHFISTVVDMMIEYGPDHPSCAPGSVGRLARHGAGYNALGRRPPILSPWPVIVTDIQRFLSYHLNKQNLETKKNLYFYFTQTFLMGTCEETYKITFKNFIFSCRKAEKELLAYLSSHNPFFPPKANTMQIRYIKQILFHELDYLEHADDAELMTTLLDECRVQVATATIEKITGHYLHHFMLRSMNLLNLLDGLIFTLQNDLGRGLCFPSYLKEVNYKKTMSILEMLNNDFENLRLFLSPAETEYKKAYEELHFSEEVVASSTAERVSELNFKLEFRRREIMQKLEIANNLQTQVNILFDPNTASSSSKPPILQTNLNKPLDPSVSYHPHPFIQAHYLINTAMTQSLERVCRLVEVMINHYPEEIVKLKARDEKDNPFEHNNKFAQVMLYVNQLLFEKYESTSSSDYLKAKAALVYAFEQHGYQLEEEKDLKSARKIEVLCVTPARLEEEKFSLVRENPQHEQNKRLREAAPTLLHSSKQWIETLEESLAGLSHPQKIERTTSFVLLTLINILDLKEIVEAEATEVQRMCKHFLDETTTSENVRLNSLASHLSKIIKRLLAFASLVNGGYIHFSALHEALKPPNNENYLFTYIQLPILNPEPVFFFHVHYPSSNSWDTFEIPSSSDIREEIKFENDIQHLIFRHLAQKSADVERMIETLQKQVAAVQTTRPLPKTSAYMQELNKLLNSIQLNLQKMEEINKKHEDFQTLLMTRPPLKFKRTFLKLSTLYVCNLTDTESYKINWKREYTHLFQAFAQEETPSASSSLSTMMSPVLLFRQRYIIRPIPDAPRQKTLAL